MPLLLGNSFPLSLVRRKVVIEPRPLAELQALAAENGVVSFWGHANTLSLAREFLGFDITPASNRPPLTLTPEGLPSLDGMIFPEVWIVSPDYAPGFRPQIGLEVCADQIHGWQILHLNFSQ